MNSAEPRRYFLTGTSDFVDGHLTTIREAAGEDISDETFYGDEFSIEQYSAFIHTPPLFEDGKLAIVKNANRVKDLADVIRRCASCVESTLVFVQESEPGKGVKDALKEAGFELKSQGKPVWRDDVAAVSAMFKDAGIPIDYSAAEELYVLKDRNLGMVRQEVTKLTIYFGNEKPDSTIKVLDILTNEKHANIFDFIDRFALRDAAGALRILRILLSHTENLNPLFFLLLKRINLVYLHVLNPSLVREAPFTMKKVKQASGQWSLSELAVLINNFASVDYAVKTGGSTIRDGLIRLTKYL